MRKLILLLCLPLVGCSTTNITKLAQAMSKDNAHVHIEVKSIYGTVTFDREMPQGPMTNIQTTIKSVAQ